MKPSVLLIPDEDAPSPIEWHAIEGIPGNIYKLNQEFNSKRGLRPIKIFVSGPPASGKTHFSKLLASEYNVPHVKVHDLIQEISQKDTELGRLVKETIDQGQRVNDAVLAEVFR